MQTSDFDYELPPALIAQAPLPGRDQSRMMVVDCAAGTIAHRVIGDLTALLHAGDLLVVNDTRVIPARLHGRWADTGGHVELLLLEEEGEGLWRCLCRGSRRAGPGRRIDVAPEFQAEIVRREDGGRVAVRFTANAPLADLLERFGEPPVPPYIARKADRAALVAMDRERYQTVFSRAPGAVAAPTAGLHFTTGLLDGLAGQGVQRVAVTLHVGPGTFKPVKAEQVEQHVMEAERYEITAVAAAAIEAARTEGRRVVAVGSTSVRTLETVAQRGAIEASLGRSALFIRPPYDFRVVDAMLTNFHLPRSTLLMMVCAFAGHRMRRAGKPDTGRELVLRVYKEAIRLQYRFYSYGDCMLLL